MAEEELADLYSGKTPDDGVIRLSRWPEGFVLWYHGVIVWRSWEKPKQEISQLVVTLDASGVKAMIDREVAAISRAQERQRRSLGRPIRL